LADEIENSLVIGIFDFAFSRRVIIINFILTPPFHPSKRRTVSDLAQNVALCPYLCGHQKDTLKNA